MAVRFGVFVPQGWKMDLVQIADPIEKYEAMTRVAQAADEGGWDSIWVYDHFHTVPEPTLEATFECWTITATLARDTKRVNIGQMVGCNGYRNPALYAKIASTVDVASHGRLYAGIGAGWYEHEWKAYGYAWPELGVRMGQFREAVQIINKMWTEDKPTFQGKHYHIDGPINEPKGVQRPYIPLWIGGGGEKITLKLVAQYAAACNIGGDVAMLKRKLGILRDHCEAVGRDYGEIIKSSNISVHLVEHEATAEQETAFARGSEDFASYAKRFVVGTPAQVRAHLEPLVAAGADYIIAYMPGVAYNQDQVRRFASDVIPHFA